MGNNTVMVDDQYTLYELHDAFSLNTPIPDQFDIFLWFSDYFCLNKGKEGFISRIVFNKAQIVSTWNIVSHNGDSKALGKNQENMKSWLRQKAMGCMKCRTIEMESGHKKTIKLLECMKSTRQHSRSSMIIMRKTWQHIVHCRYHPEKHMS